MELDALLWRLDTLRVPKAGFLLKRLHSTKVCNLHNARICPQFWGVAACTCMETIKLYLPQLVSSGICGGAAARDLVYAGLPSSVSDGLVVYAAPGSKFLYPFLVYPKDVQYIEFFAGTGNMHAAMAEVYNSLRFDIMDHDAEPGRTNFMDFNSASGYAWST